MVTKLTLVAILCIVSIVWLSCILFAYADQYRTLGIKHADVPLVCIFEPDSLYTDNIDGIIQAAQNSVDLWQEKLYEYSQDGNWKLPIAVIPIEDHKYKVPRDFPICNILISFEYVNEESRSLGYTGIDFSKSNHKFTHIVIFTHDLQITHHFDLTSGSEGKFVNTSIRIEKFSITAIQNITTHEMGHALGLGHYQITDYPVYTDDKPWIEASIMYYLLNPQDDEIAEPKYVDVKMMEKIYTDDGFGGVPAIPIPKIGYYSAGDIEICTFKCNIFRQ